MTTPERMPEKVSISAALDRVQRYWDPHIVAELNSQKVMVAKLLGEFVWHAHEREDELFYVVSGSLEIEFRDRTVTLHAGEMQVVPRGVEHRPVAREEVTLLLFEPMETLNTGNVTSELTIRQPKRL